MESITVSSKGQIAIPKAVREALNLTEGTQLTVEVRGQEIILSKEPGWKQLRGMAADPPDLTDTLLGERRKDREREDQ